MSASPAGPPAPRSRLRLVAGRRGAHIALVVVLVVAVGLVATKVPCVRAGRPAGTATSSGDLARYAAAAAYSRAHHGLSMVVMKEGRVVYEDYRKGQSAGDAHLIYSGTKSFSCALAVTAAMDGMLTFDERVSDTITEWRGDARAAVTIRQLLSLTSGIDAGEQGNAPTYAESVEAELLHPPGTTFQYGPYPFAVFGELMRRKLAARDVAESPGGYLVRRVLAPIGLQVESWRLDDDGNFKLSGGMVLTAREWAKYGQLLLDDGRWGGRTVLDPRLLAQCYGASSANPGYAMTFWLPTRDGTSDKGRSTRENAEALRRAHAPEDVYKASGNGLQRMYVIPSQDLVIVRQAPTPITCGHGFVDSGFLAPIFASP